MPISLFHMVNKQFESALIVLGTGEIVLFLDDLLAVSVKICLEGVKRLYGILVETQQQGLSANLVNWANRRIS